MAALNPEPGAEYRHAWMRPRETSIVFYGPDAEAMFAAIERILKRRPKAQSPISAHIRNVLQEGELDPTSTVRKYLTVRTEGNRSTFWVIEH